MTDERIEQYEKDCARATEIAQLLAPKGGWNTNGVQDIDDAAHNLVAFGCNSDDVESAFRMVVGAVVRELGQSEEWGITLNQRS